MHMNQMYFSALKKGGGILQKYAIVQQMQMFKKETWGIMGIKEHIPNLKTVKAKTKIQGELKTVKTNY